MRQDARLRDHLEFLYGRAGRDEVWPALRTRLEDFQRRHPELAGQNDDPGQRLTERDAFVITYGDQVTEPGRPPLHTLAEFFETHLGDAVAGVHLLPHFPYSSDDGFSVIDYRRVDPRLGDWNDVARLGRRYRRMFDAVINHISRESEWFRGFLDGRTPYRDYFITCDPATDLSQVVRPRALPLLTQFHTLQGVEYVWTTFSDDQIDLNYANPRVLLEIVDVLLCYVERGAELLRLDAIAYLWKQPGTACIHLPQTHRVVKLFRAVLDAVAPGVLLITETNVPHADNIRYFGDGTDEAQMVYNFALPPLVLHTFRTGSCRRLREWAGTLTTPSPATTFFNFLASHDGIGVMPARGLLRDDEMAALVEQTRAHGGRVSMRSLPDGTQTPYELNVTLFDALNAGDDEVAVRRFLASQVIMLSLAGVPGIYVHSLFGTRNWHEGVAQTGRARTINRQKFQRAALEAELADAGSLKRRVFDGYRSLLGARRSHPAFHPNAAQRILSLGDAVFGVLRTGAGGAQVVALVNVTGNPQPVRLEMLPASVELRDLITGRKLEPTLNLQPYECVWLAI
jgi:glycosidase